MKQRARYIYKDHLFHLSIFLMGVLLYLIMSPYIKNIVYLIFITVFVLNVVGLSKRRIYPEISHVERCIYNRFKWIKEMVTVLLSFIVIQSMVIGYDESKMHWLLLILSYIEAHMLVDLWYKLTLNERSVYQSTEEKLFIRFMHTFNFLGLIGVIFSHYYMDSFYSLHIIIEIHLSYIIFIALPSYLIKYGYQLYKVYI